MKSSYKPEATWITMKCGNPNRDWQHWKEEDFAKHEIFFLTTRREKIENRFIKELVGMEEAKKRGSVWVGGELAHSVVRVFDDMIVDKYRFIKNPIYKFDLLFGFTAAIREYYFWMKRHPYGWKGHRVLETLGLCWKSLLRDHTPREMGLDEEFSYQGLLEFLAGFKVDVEEELCDCPLRLAFHYK
jgi:hypothetical protein